MRRHLTEIVLLVTALAFVLYLWLGRDKVSEGEKQARSNNLFSAWRREELSRLEIAHEGETIVLVRDAKTDSSWRMTSPRVERVDQAAAERLFTTLEFATIVRRVEPLESFGLDAPRASGSIAMGPLVMKFALGKAAPRPEGASYIRIDDNPPVVASKELTEALLASSDTLRDRTVIPYLSLDVVRLEAKHPAGGFTLVRSDERSFKVEGTNTLASRAAVDKIWAALAEVRAESFPKDADADRLTANPSLAITLVPKDGKPPGELVFGEACPGHPNDVVVLRKRPTRIAACAPKGAVEALVVVTPSALVDLRPFSFRHDEIEELRLEQIGGPVVEVARRGTGFHEREPTDRELAPDEAEAVSDLLSRLDLVHADELGQGPFTATYRARARAGERDDTLEIAALDGPRVLARRGSDGALLVLSRAVARMLVPRKTTFRKLAIGAPAESVKHIALRCGTKQDLTDDGAGLRLVDPPGYPTDGSITQLVDGLQKGKAIAWVADADDGTFGFGACRVDLDGKVALLLGKDGEGGVYARLESGPEVFVAPPGLATLARRIYVSHGSLRAEPASITAVKATDHGRPVANVDAAAAGDLYADRVLKLGTADVGPVEIEISITVADSGAPRTIDCGAVASTAEGRWRPCSTSGVKATFAVPAVRVDRVLGVPDAGAR